MSVVTSILPLKESGVPALEVLPRPCNCLESVKESRSLSSGRLLGPDAIVHPSLAIAGGVGDDGLCQYQESQLSGGPIPTPNGC